jgi:putative transposase
LDLPDVPQHIVQRGNNRSACFFEDGHRRLYLELLQEAARAAEVALHAYVLMTNHVHLLATPRRTGSVSAVMQAVGRRYVQRINKLRGRTGTLFDGRFKNSLVQTERYLLCCYRYIELNPVRAGMAADPAEYRWSSYRCNAFGEYNDLITLQPLFAELSGTPEQRQARYRDFVAEGVSPDEGEAIRAHLKQGCALGSADFQARVEAATGRAAGLRPKGRPLKKGEPKNGSQKMDLTPLFE